MCDLNSSKQHSSTLETVEAPSGVKLVLCGYHADLFRSNLLPFQTYNHE